MNHSEGRVRSTVMDVGRRNPLPLHAMLEASTYDLATDLLMEMQAIGWTFTPPPACPYDTNDDGDCGRPLCPHCGTYWEDGDGSPAPRTDP